MLSAPCCIYTDVLIMRKSRAGCRGNGDAARRSLRGRTAAAARLDCARPRTACPAGKQRLLAVFDFLEVGVDDVVLLLGRFLRTGVLLAVAGAAGGLLGLRVGVHLLAQLLRGARQRSHFGVDFSLVAGLDRAFEVGDGRFDLFFLARFQLVAVFDQRLAGRVHQRVGLVARLGQLLDFLVFFGVDFGVLDHLLDFRFGQAGVGLDRDLVLFAGGLVFRADVQDAVGVDVEGHFNLRRAARGRRDAFQIEFAQALVAGRDFALALEDLDGHGRLVVVGGREHLRELGRDRRVLVDHLGHHAAQGFDTQRQRRHVQQQQVLALARQYRTLDGGADGDGFVRVDVLARILAEELFDLFLHLGHTGHTADQDDVVDVRHFHAGILDRHFAWLHGGVDQFLDQRFQLGAGHLQRQVDRRAVGHGDVGLVDLGLLRRRQFDLGALGRSLDALQGDRIFLQVQAIDLLELFDDVIDDALVEVFAAQEGVAVGRQHFELFFAIDVGDFNDGHVEGTAAQVIHGDLAVALFGLVQAESQRGRGWLIDDALDVQTGDTACVLGGLALRVVEVSRHGDDRFGDFFTEVVFGGLFHLAQHFGRDLRWRQFLVAHADPCVAVVGFHDRVRHQADVLLHFFFVELAADQTFDGEQRVLRIGDGLAFRRRADEDFAIFLVSNDRGRRTRAFGVFDYLWLTIFHDGNAGICRSQIDTDNSTHDISSFLLKFRWY